jgi:DNA replication protein DnaC
MDTIGNIIRYDTAIAKKISDGDIPCIAEEKKANENDILRQKIILSFGKHYADKSFENFRDEKNTIGKAKKALEKNMGLYIYGKSRTGKTHLACGIYRHIHKTISHNVLFRKCVELDILFSDYNDDERLRKIELLKKVDYLFLDDIGVGKLTQERHSMYYYVIDYRLSNDLWTCYTSNYMTNELWKGSTDADPARIISRIRETCKGIAL